jgi:hypothetical protein
MKPSKRRNNQRPNKWKKYYDKKDRRKEIFKIGNKVLYYNVTKRKQWLGKLEERFKGPYYIHEELLNGSYKIKELSEKKKYIKNTS